jgi:hypothetical protein
MAPIDAKDRRVDNDRKVQIGKDQRATTLTCGNYLTSRDKTSRGAAEKNKTISVSSSPRQVRCMAIAAVNDRPKTHEELSKLRVRMERERVARGRDTAAPF